MIKFKLAMRVERVSQVHYDPGENFYFYPVVWNSHFYQKMICSEENFSFHLGVKPTSNNSESDDCLIPFRSKCSVDYFRSPPW